LQKKYRISLTTQHALHICGFTEGLTPVLPDLATAVANMDGHSSPRNQIGDDDWPPDFVGQGFLGVL
jgi:hypothetical protein